MYSQPGLVNVKSILQFSFVICESLSLRHTIALLSVDVSRVFDLSLGNPRKMLTGYRQDVGTDMISFCCFPK